MHGLSQPMHDGLRKPMVHAGPAGSLLEPGSMGSDHAVWARAVDAMHEMMDAPTLQRQSSFEGFISSLRGAELAQVARDMPVVGGQLLTMLKAKIYFTRAAAQTRGFVGPLSDCVVEDLSPEEHEHVREVWEDFGSHVVDELERCRSEANAAVSLAKTSSPPLPASAAAATVSPLADVPSDDWWLLQSDDHGPDPEAGILKPTPRQVHKHPRPHHRHHHHTDVQMETYLRDCVFFQKRVEGLTGRQTTNEAICPTTRRF